MANKTCPAITDPNTVWPPFCPNIGASYFFAILFGLTFIAHLVQMTWHKKVYSWVITFSAALQLATYILRTLSIIHPANVNFYTYWFVFMMVAPVFTNAYVYMVMGRTVYNHTTKGSVFGIKAWRFGLIFVLLDVFALLVQIAGASMASGSGKSTSTIMNGLHIYMGGIGFQQLCIFGFLALAVRLHMHLRQQSPSPQRKTAFTLLYVQYTVVLLITLRIIFRLIEYSNGLTSTIPQHEAYQYILDSLPMLVALVLFNFFHPGRLMPGKESNMPSRKQRKALRKQGDQPIGRAEYYLMVSKSTPEHSREGSESGLRYDVTTMPRENE